MSKKVDKSQMTLENGRGDKSLKKVGKGRRNGYLDTKKNFQGVKFESIHRQKKLRSNSDPKMIENTF